MLHSAAPDVARSPPANRAHPVGRRNRSQAIRESTTNPARRTLAGDQSLIARIVDPRQVAKVVATATAGSGITACDVWRGRRHFAQPGWHRCRRSGNGSIRRRQTHETCGQSEATALGRSDMCSPGGAREECLRPGRLFLVGRLFVGPGSAERPTDPGAGRTGRSIRTSSWPRRFQRQRIRIRSPMPRPG